MGYLLERRPRMTTETSPEPTRDLADIGPDNLWAVWSRVAEFIMAHDPKGDSVSVEWILASPEKSGLDEIAVEYPTSLIAAVPLSTLRQVSEALSVPGGQAHPGWVRTAMGLGGPKQLSLIEDARGDTRISSRKASSRERILLKGNLRDFHSLMTEGNRILVEKDWMAISDDARSFAQTKPVKWFHHQRTPEAAAILRDWAQEKQE